MSAMLKFQYYKLLDMYTLQSLPKSLKDFVAKG